MQSAYVYQNIRLPAEVDASHAGGDIHRLLQRVSDKNGSALPDIFMMIPTKTYSDRAITLSDFNRQKYVGVPTFKLVASQVRKRSFSLRRAQLTDPREIHVHMKHWDHKVCEPNHWIVMQ